MSHVVSMKLKIKDLECLQRAAESLGLEFKENQKTYRWFGQWLNDYRGEDAAYLNGVRPQDYGKCVHALSLKDNPNAYEIGVLEAKDGQGYELIFDNWSGGGGRALIEAVGKNGEKLKQNYSTEIAKKFCKSKGMPFTTKTKQDGTVIITAKIKG